MGFGSLGDLTGRQRAAFPAHNPGMGGNLTFRIKELFFDRAVVKRAVDRATLDALRKAGGLIRRIAHACGIDWARLVRRGLAQFAAEAGADPLGGPETQEWPAQPAEVLFAHEAPAPWDGPVPQPGKAVG